MWKLFCNGSTNYRFIFMPTNKYHLYGIVFKKEQEAIYVNGFNPNNYSEFGLKFIPSYAGHEEDWNTYYRQFYSLGWGEDIREGLGEDDERVRKILSDRKIKEIFNKYLYIYRYRLINDIFQ